MKTEIVSIYDENGMPSVCECEVGGTRVIRILSAPHDRDYVLYKLQRVAKYLQQDPPRYGNDLVDRLDIVVKAQQGVAGGYYALQHWIWAQENL